MPEEFKNGRRTVFLNKRDSVESDFFTPSNIKTVKDGLSTTLSVSTNDATPTVLLLNGEADSRFVIPEGKMYACTVTILGSEDDAAGGVHYVRKVAIANQAGTTALVGAVSTVGTDVETTAGYDVAITADDTNDALQIQVTGLAATNCSWKAIVDYVELNVPQSA